MDNSDGAGWDGVKLNQSSWSSKSKLKFEVEVLGWTLKFEVEVWSSFWSTDISQ